MNVWIVEEGAHYEGSNIEAVCESYEAAIFAADRFIGESFVRIGDKWEWPPLQEANVYLPFPHPLPENYFVSITRWEVEGRETT